jgi:2-C-methyl-D-erythritol 4-phosphate cytidylyltransferase
MTTFWAVIPAAGTGRRMGDGAAPKQYARLLDRYVLEWSMDALLKRSECRGLVVALAADDEQFATLPASRDKRVVRTTGGPQRSDSVLAGLKALADKVSPEDWVLVHDAARPCLSNDEIDRLLTELANDPIGGLLAIPVADTLKRCDADGRVVETVERTHLWRALTPQMFRYGTLVTALTQARDVTDEASAIERMGLKPRVVMGSSDNVKITYPEDLERAARILERVSS